METSFISMWALLKPQGEYKRRRRGCERLWESYDEATRQQVYDTIHAAHERGDRINPNPYFAIEDVVLQLKRKQPLQILSYADYYKRYGTTEERGGWRMENPTGRKVIYVKRDFLGSFSGLSRDVIP